MVSGEGTPWLIQLTLLRNIVHIRCPPHLPHNTGCVFTKNNSVFVLDSHPCVSPTTITKPPISPKRSDPVRNHFIGGILSIQRNTDSAGAKDIWIIKCVGARFFFFTFKTNSKENTCTAQGLVQASTHKCISFTPIIRM